MIHIGRQVPRIVIGRGQTSLFHLNESLLIPWRLAAFIFHCTALLCVADYRGELITSASLLPGYTPEDYDHFAQSAQAVVALTILCLAICISGVVTARSLRVTGMNFLHCVCHTVGGMLLIMVWYHTSHVERLWHIFYIFSIIPSGLEVLCVAHSYRRGLDVWG